MKGIPVILMGCGGVGRQLIQHIVSCRTIHANQGVRLRVVGVADSKSLISVSDILTTELDDQSLHEICRLKSSGCSLSAFACLGASHSLSTAEATAAKIAEVTGHLLRSSGVAVVDCSASTDTIGILKNVVEMGGCIVLANKKPLTSSLHLILSTMQHCKYYVLKIWMMTQTSLHTSVFSFCRARRRYIYWWTLVLIFSLLEHLLLRKPNEKFVDTQEDYDKLVLHPRRLRHESTVGAGLPVIVSINRLISSGDTVRRIVGSLSGTLGYVMSEVEDGKPFSQVVKTAKSLGYTEPDPRDDLGGMDVARKALIIARLLGQRIELNSIKVESLYPEEMGPKAMNVEEFLANGLPQLDSQIAERVRKAASNGNVLRYACMIEGSRCEVGVQELPKNSALGRLRGSDNVLEVYSRCYSEQPLVIQGAGAGNDTTAAGVLADILDIQDLFT